MTQATKIAKFIEAHGFKAHITADCIYFFVPGTKAGNIAYEHKFTVTTLREAAHALGY